MRPTRLTASNLGVFEALDLSLPLGAVAVTGPNGAGKSTLVESFDRVLFGARDMREWATTGEEDAAMMLALEFDHLGQSYRVRRSYSPRGRGKPSLDFEVLDELADEHVEAWRPLSRESIKETQAELERVLGFSQATFRASAFLMQSGEGSFTDPGLDARRRKEIFFDLLNLDVYERLVDAVRSRMVTIRDETTRLSIQVEEAGRELESKATVEAAVTWNESEVATAAENLRLAELNHKQAAENLSASRESAAKLEAARTVLATRERELAALTTRAKQISLALEDAAALPKLKETSETLAGRRESIERDLVQAVEAETARNEHRRLTAERDRIVAEVADLNERATQLREQAEVLLSVREGATERCQLCEQVLGFEAATTSAVKLHEQADELRGTARGKLDVVGDDYDPLIARAAESMASGPNAAKQAELEAELRVAREAEKTLAGIDERMKRVEELKAEQIAMPGLHGAQLAVDATRAAVEKLEAVSPDHDLEAAVARSYGVVLEARGRHEQGQSNLAVARAEADRLKQVEERAAANRKALAGHQGVLDILLDAERRFGKNGLPAYILENRALPFMEAKANEYLGRLGGKTASARIELRTQREKRSGDGMIEALDIVVLTAEGFERRYERWSGGEQMRIEIALRLALLVLSGAEIGILVLDEPGNLDESGKADLIELLGSVLSLGVERVLLVSHDSDLRDAFDSSIEVEIGEDGRSQVVGASAPEAVAV